MYRNNDTQWPAMEGPVPEERSLDIWGFLKRRKSFVIVLAVLGTGLGYLLFQQEKSEFRSIAWVEVIQRGSDRETVGFPGKASLADAMFVIPSPDVLRPAYVHHELSRLETLRGFNEDEAANLIASGMLIQQLSTGVIEIQFTGRHPQDATRITNAVAEEFIQRQSTVFESETDKLKRLLEGDRGRIESLLQVAETKYNEFMQEGRLLTAAGDSGQSQGRLSALNGRISELDIEKAEVKARLSLFNEKLSEDGQREALLVLIGKELEAVELSASDVDVQRRKRNMTIENSRRLSASLVPLVVEEALLGQRLGPKHPRLKDIRQKIELIRREYSKMGKMLPELEPVRSASQPKSDYLQVYHQSLSHQLEKLQSQQTALQSLASAAEDETRLVHSAEQTEMRLRKKVERLENELRSITTRIEQAELNAGMGGVRATVIKPATPGFLVYPVFYKFLGLGGFLGAIAGLGLGYLVELADRSFRKPEEVVREFGVPILGHIPLMKSKLTRGKAEPGSEELAPTLICASKPRSRPAEAFRSVRTAVCFTASGDTHRVLQITSPAAGDGKSTLAANLAISLAQSGKKTILVESDFRRPKVHRLTGISNDVGIVEVLRDQAELADAIQTVDVDSLDVLPCGKRPGNPSELLTRPEYEALLEVLREMYDYVVVDTPPTLVVTDSCSVAPRVDAVIMCVRLGRHTRDLGRRSLGQLREIGANTIGIVINGVEESDAYGYGSYNYSDYRGYAYTYSNDDVYQESNNVYLAEDDSEQVKRLLSSDDQ